MYIKEAPKKITQKMIQNDEQLHNLLCSVFSERFNEARLYAQPKQSILRWYDNETLQMQRRPDLRLKTKLSFQMKKTFIAMFKNEWLTPVFDWFDWNDNELARKINQIAKFDEKVMKKAVKDEIMLWYVFDYWVWIRLWWYYSQKYNLNEYIVVDPLNRYADPRGNSIDNNYDYHFFLLDLLVDNLHYINDEAWEEIYFNLDKVSYWDPRSPNSRRKKQLRAFSDQNSYEWKAYCYHLQANVNWRKYKVTLNSSLSAILRREEIEPVSKQEKDCPSIVPFDLSITHAFPLVEDNYWLSYRELIIDNDIAMNKILNAIYMKELTNAWFGNHLVDVSIVKNLHLLSYKSDDWANYIWVDWRGKNLDWAVRPVQDQQNTNTQYSFFQFLSNQAQVNTMLTDLVRWAWAWAWTLWQSEILVEKSNINFSLDADMLSIWEQQFWENIYLRSLKQNVLKIKNKVVNLTWDYDAFVKLEKSDFIWSYDLNVTITSHRKKQEQDKDQWLKLKSFFPMMQSLNGEVPISMRLYLREILYKDWFDQPFVEWVVKLTPSEERSRAMQAIINLDQMPKNLLKPWVDLDTLKVYVWQCVENDTKQKAILIINDQIIKDAFDKPKESEMWASQNMWWVMNAMGSQMMSQEMNKQPQNLNPQQTNE